MKFAIPMAGGKLTLHFGHCQDFAIINVEDNQITGKDGFGHSYFRNAPTVSSDLIIMLRDDADPGSPERPLEYIGAKFWRVPPGYPTFD